MTLVVTLSSSDCRYSLSPAKGNATHIFLKPSLSEEVIGIFGVDSKQGDHFALTLNRSNIADNLIHHYVRHTQFFDKESGNNTWCVSIDYLRRKLNELDEAFAAEEDMFDVSINRQTTGQKRTFLTGINNTTSLTTHKPLRFKDFFFGGDQICLKKEADGKLTLSLLPKPNHDDGQNDATDVSEATKVDCLTIALKLFAEQRRTDWKVHGWQVNALMRGHFGTMTEAAIRAYQANDVRDFFFGKLSIAGGSEQADVMWSGKGNSGWSNIQKALNENAQAVADFLGDLCKDTTVVAKYWQDDFARPQGFGPAVVTELLMKFHPESCFKHGSVTREALTYLGLVDFASEKSDYDYDEYKLVCGAAALILARMKTMKLPRQINVDGSEDKAKPDYLTVNEFIWFVKEHFKEISNEAKNMSLEAPKLDQKNPGDKKWKDVISDNPDDMMSRLIAALLTKPFAILAGASGTGKSRLVRKLAYMTCLNAQLQPNSEAKKSIENFKMVQVKPNWHDSTSLLGYRSAVSGAADYVSTDFVRFILKAHAFPTTPFFVCLDEMNLAPVEHYFAEFLSAMESGREENGEWITDPIVEPGEFSGTLAQLDPQGYSLSTERQALIEKHGLYIPKNLFVVGTVNMDDTTRGFSRKVLDRAMTIVMDQINFDELKHSSDLVLKDVKEGDEIKVKGLLLEESVIKEFVERKDFDPNAFDEAFQGKLNALREKLDNTPLAFAYRLARECTQYREAMRMLYGGAVPTIADFDELALDHCVFMKLLPRLAGNVEERQAVVNGLNAFIPTLGSARVLSAKAFKRMMDASEFNGGYLSFWP